MAHKKTKYYKYHKTNQIIVHFKVVRQQTPCWKGPGAMSSWANERRPSLISVPSWGSTRNTFRPSVEEASLISCWINKRSCTTKKLSGVAVADVYVIVLKFKCYFPTPIGMHTWHPGSTSDKCWHSHQRHPVTQGQGPEAGLRLAASVLSDQSVRCPGH